MLCRINTPSLPEIDEMEPGQIVCTFAHLAAASTTRFQKLVDKGVTVLAYELLTEEGGTRPLQRAVSEIAGRMVPQIAAWLLQSPNGLGLMLPGIPGLPAAEVAILGAGEVGFNAARTFAGLGAQVTVLDTPNRLAELDRIFDVPGQIRLMYSYSEQLAKVVSYANVFVGAILHPGERAPQVVTEEMVANMRPGAVIIDVAIDQGGCVETSRPTTLRDPFFEKHGVIHYCVPNFTALAARTTTRAVSAVVRPYLVEVANDPASLAKSPQIRPAVLLHNGKVVNPQLARAQNRELVDIEETA
jgi:alanine dehydrogenase